MKLNSSPIFFLVISRVIQLHTLQCWDDCCHVWRFVWVLNIYANVFWLHGVNTVSFLFLYLGNIYRYIIMQSLSSLMLSLIAIFWDLPILKNIWIVYCFHWFLTIWLCEYILFIYHLLIEFKYIIFGPCLCQGSIAVKMIKATVF